MRDSRSPSLPKSWTLKVTAGDDVRRTDAMLDACSRWTWEKELSIAFFLDGLVSQSLGHSVYVGVLNLFKDSRLISRHLGSGFLGRNSEEQRHRHTQEECERSSRPALQAFPAKSGILAAAALTFAALNGNMEHVGGAADATAAAWRLHAFEFPHHMSSCRRFWVLGWFQWSPTLCWGAQQLR